MLFRSAATNGAPLRYVVGAPDHAGRLAYYAPTRPSLFEDADPTRSPWIDRNDLERQGALAVWAMSDMSANPPGWFAKLARAEVQPPVTFQAYNWGPVRTAIYGWAIVPPAQAAGIAR